MTSTMAQSAWSAAIVFVLQREGGYVNDPHDTGGETKFGISKRAYPAEDIRGLTLSRATELYERDYWRPCGAAQFAGTRPRLALVHFDWAVNHGVAGAIRTLQLVVRADPDGVFGSQTLGAVLSCDEDRAIADYLERRAAWYRQRVAHRPDQAKWLEGWLARLRHCARATGVPITPALA